MKEGHLYHCHVCRTRLPADQFHRNSGRKIGLASKCKRCAAVVNYRIKKARWQGRCVSEAYYEALEVARSLYGRAA